MATTTDVPAQSASADHPGKPATPQDYRRKQLIRNVLQTAGLLVIVVWCLFPFLWMLSNSLRGGTVALTDPNILTGPFSVENYQQVFGQNFHFALRNTVIVAGGTSVITIPLAAMAGYALARLGLKNRRLLLAGVLVATVFPPVALVPPLFRAYVALNRTLGLGLIDTYPGSYVGMIIPYVALTLPLAIFIMTTFFAGIPKELEESAKVDGASPFNAFRRVILPLAAPGVGAAAILTFVYATNEFLLAQTFAPTNDSVRTVPVFIGNFDRIGYENPLVQIMAASVLVSFPLILFALALQKRIVAGLTSGAVKG